MTNRYKSVMDFKVRVLDFISIYAVQQKKNKKPLGTSTSLMLVKGLLNSLKVAHQDEHTTLFERVKSVLSTIAKQGVSSEEQSAELIKEQKILMTETMAMVMAK